MIRLNCILIGRFCYQNSFWDNHINEQCIFQLLHHVACQGLVVEIMATDIPPLKENNPLKALQVARLVWGKPNAPVLMIHQCSNYSSFSSSIRLNPVEEIWRVSILLYIKCAKITWINWLIKIFAIESIYASFWMFRFSNVAPEFK